MAIGVVEVELLEAVGAGLEWRGDADVVGGDGVGSFGDVVDGEGEVVRPASGLCSVA